MKDLLCAKSYYLYYHGVFVNIQPQKGKLTPSSVDFIITPGTLQNVKERGLLINFLLEDISTNCVITQPLAGELVAEHSESAIKSIELQLVPMETCGCAQGYARDITEIQNIQIAHGDVRRSLSVPIHIFPRLFTSALETTTFKVESEVSIIVLLHADILITENFPLKLCRMSPMRGSRETGVTDWTSSWLSDCYR
ncbi:LOW QUALITY PROTEIN: vacuolar protein sorting-associated protein 26C-like [Trichechus inunguis]